MVAKVRLEWNFTKLATQLVCGCRASRLAGTNSENCNPRQFQRGFPESITSPSGFGGEKRKALVKAAYDAGVNFFDVTHILRKGSYRVQSGTGNAAALSGLRPDPP